MKKRKYKYYIEDFKKFIISTTLLIILLIYITLDIALNFNNKEINNTHIKYKPYKIEYEEYTVVSGDTLWNIADIFYPEIDNREIVDLIKMDNMCSSNLKIGQVLKIRKK